MGKAIKKLYTSKGIKPPKGKGEHTIKFHKMATAIMEKEKKNGLTKAEKTKAYKISMAKLGRNKAVNKSHWRTGTKKKKTTKKIKKTKK